MPVHCELRNKKWRIIEPDGKIATTKLGKARDGGGHPSKVKCEKQMRAINMPKN